MSMWSSLMRGADLRCVNYSIVLRLAGATLVQIASIHIGLVNGVSADHRRRMETEAKAKFVASVWGAKFIQFLAALAVLTRSISNRLRQFS